MDILFASHNEHKVNEVKKLLPEKYSLIGLRDIGWRDEIPEPFQSYAENAKAKALYLFDRTGISCFADDSGLEIDALHGRPGIMSARYAGVPTDSMRNIEKVMYELSEEKNRKARFVAVVAFVTASDRIATFRGIVEGSINRMPMGDGGFGYDPIFIPDGFDLTFSQLSESLKNQISHRAKAMQKFVEYLRKLNI